MITSPLIKMRLSVLLLAVVLLLCVTGEDGLQENDSEVQSETDQSASRVKRASDPRDVDEKEQTETVKDEAENIGEGVVSKETSGDKKASKKTSDDKRASKKTSGDKKASKKTSGDKKASKKTSGDKKASKKTSGNKKASKKTPAEPAWIPNLPSPMPKKRKQKAKFQLDGYCMCRGNGDPHYRNFGSKRFNFQGHCSYTFVKTNSGIIGDCALNVEVENVPRKGGRVSVTNRVKVEMQGHTIDLLQKRVVKVDGEVVDVKKKSIEIGNILITSRGRYVEVEDTKCNSKIFFSGKLIKVFVPKRIYEGHTMGLCGNCGDTKSDLPMGANGEQAKSFSKSDLFAWGTTFLVPHIGDEKPPGTCYEEPVDTETCARTWEYTHSKLYCGLIIKNETHPGPLSSCLAHKSKEDVEAIRDACVLDMCNTDDEETRKKIVCETLSDISEMCQARDIEPEDWRSPSDCSTKCGRHEVYKHDVKCEPTCANPKLKRSDPCNEPPTEGCVCKPGYIRNHVGTDCVKKADFECLSEGYEWCQCSVYGDPHMIRFNGTKLTFQAKTANAEYILAQSNDARCPFTVMVLVNFWYHHVNLTDVTEVYIMMGTHIVRLLKGRQVDYEGQLGDPSTFGMKNGLQFTKIVHEENGKRFHYVTVYYERCQFSVSFDPVVHSVVIRAGKEKYTGNTLGACGVCA